MPKNLEVLPPVDNQPNVRRRSLKTRLQALAAAVGLVASGAAATIRYDLLGDWPHTLTPAEQLVAFNNTWHFYMAQASSSEALDVQFFTGKAFTLGITYGGNGIAKDLSVPHFRTEVLGSTCLQGNVYDPSLGARVVDTDEGVYISPATATVSNTKALFLDRNEDTGIYFPRFREDAAILDEQHCPAQ